MLPLRVAQDLRAKAEKFRFEEDEILYISPSVLVKFAKEFPANTYLSVYFSTSEGVSRARVEKAKKNIALNPEIKLLSRRKRNAFYKVPFDKIEKEAEFLRWEHSNNPIAKMHIVKLEDFIVLKFY